MSYENLILDKENEIAILYINRPKYLNALNAQTLEELSRAIDEVQRDPAIKVR